MKNNIVLIGFMGSGKTSVGNKLAQELGYSFLDTDEKIEQDSGTTISRLFAEKGEEYFRDLETKTLKTMIGQLEHTIIATGGGLPIRECNQKLLKQLGFVVYLKVSKESVLKRLEGDTSRPLLAGEQAEEKVETLLEYRSPIYQAVAHCVILVDKASLEQKNGIEDRTLEEISEEIIKASIIR